MAKRRQTELRRRFSDLADLYEKFIEPRFRAAAGHRNGFIVEATPFLYRVVCPTLTIGLLEFFYEMHRHLFKDPPEQHRRESIAMLESVAATYRQRLGDTERAAYGMLTDTERDVFRILRDLAFLPEPRREPLSFFMSCKELADRMQMDRKSASRMLMRFEADYGVIRTVTKGKPWQLGERPQATVYKWLLKSVSS